MHKRLFRPRWLSFGFAVFLASAAACSSDDAGSKSAGSGSHDGGIYDELGIKNPNPTEFFYNSVPVPYKTPEECKTFDTEHAARRACNCGGCFDLQQQC